MLLACILSYVYCAIIVSMWFIQFRFSLSWFKGYKNFFTGSWITKSFLNNFGIWGSKFKSNIWDQSGTWLQKSGSLTTLAWVSPFQDLNLTVSRDDNLLFLTLSYCTLHKHVNSEVQKPTDDCVFRCCQSS